MISSRNLVKSTLEFENPSRIPRQIWFLPWANQKYPNEVRKIQTDFPDDITKVPGVYKKNPKTVGDACALGIFIDEWGCVFENKQSGIIGEVKEPLVKSWEDLDKVSVPNELLTIDIESINSFCRNSDKHVMSDSSVRPFERLQFLRGSENTYMDLALQTDGFKTLLDRIHQFYVKELEQWAQTDVDSLFFMDDWGTQKSLLISPAMWRQTFKPLYKEYIEIAHQHGKKIFMHSDGYILDILPDLIEIGLDSINSQIFCMGVEKIGNNFKGQITFWGEIDRQHILPGDSIDDVQNAVKQVQNTLYENGGVIAQCEFGPGAKPENVYTVFQTWNEFNRY